MSCNLKIIHAISSSLTRPPRLFRSARVTLPLIIMILIMLSRTWTGLNIRLSASGTQQIGWDGYGK